MESLAKLAKSSGSSSSTGSKQPLSVGFNQDKSLITVGGSRGFRIYRCNPFKKCFQAAHGSIKIVEMLFSTSLVALVGAGKQPAFSPRRIRLYNTTTNEFFCELDFATTVLNVKMNSKRLVAVLENKIHIFDLKKSLHILHTLRTPSNPKGVIALSSNVKNGFMALPGHESKGEILVYDVINLQVQSSINACNNPIQKLSMNNEGTLLAAASTQGTVIRVFSIPGGTKLYTFRRGSYPVTIHSIAFSFNSTHIAVSSSSRTIHIFGLSSESKKRPKLKSKASASSSSSSSSAAAAVVSSASSSAASASSAIASYLPNLLSDIVEPGRHFAFVNLKDSSDHTVVGFGQNNKKKKKKKKKSRRKSREEKDDHEEEEEEEETLQLLVLSSQGHLSKYTVPENGGECKLGMEFPLTEKPDEEMGVKIHGKGAAQTLFHVQYDYRTAGAASGGGNSDNSSKARVERVAVGDGKINTANNNNSDNTTASKTNSVFSLEDVFASTGDDHEEENDRKENVAAQTTKIPNYVDDECTKPQQNIEPDIFIESLPK